MQFPSRIGSIAGAAAAAQEFARLAGFQEDALFWIDIAVREAVANAVLHGNCQDESKPVEVRIIASEAGLIVTVRDQCESFQPAEVADPTAAENLLKASGRGILFMRTFMDEVAWERHPGGGTIVRMIKKR